MTKHMTGTRKEWLAARLELLEAEKELTRRSDELARRRQELPWVRIDKEYRFETDEGNSYLRGFRSSRNANDHSSVGAQPRVDPRRITGIVVPSIQDHLHLRISPEGVAEVRI